jgi:hypothetical protein
MKITDVIRKIIDIIDQEEDAVEQQPRAEPDVTAVISNNDELARIIQIAGLLPTDEPAEYANEPEEKYADIDSVTTCAGGGVNGPKHPADIRGSTQSMYPGKVWGAQ